jgi:CO/xanthine dehydrogenase Mo-binding subunit
MILDFAAQQSGAPRESCALSGEAVTCAGRRIALTDLQRAAVAAGVELSASGHSDGMRRSVAFNVQGFRVAVNPVTGEIRILKSVQAADAGTVINPMQCRGQVEGGVAQALGAALFEEVVVDASGRVVNPAFRNYHLPAFVDVPRTQVLFADTSDTLGPSGAKSMSESPYNPVAAALGNAIRDATGVRFYKLPFKPDRIFAPLASRMTAGDYRTQQ